MNLQIFFSTFFSACFRSLCGVKTSDSECLAPLPGAPLTPGCRSCPHQELLLLPIVHLGLFLPFLLQSGCYCLILPPDLMSQTPQVSKLQGHKAVRTWKVPQQHKGELENPRDSIKGHIPLPHRSPSWHQLSPWHYRHCPTAASADHREKIAIMCQS